MWYFSEEEKELQRLCRDFAREELAPCAEKFDREEGFNLGAFKKMGQLGLLGVTASEEYGGAGLGALAATIAMEEFGRACASSTLSYLAHSILCVNNIQQNGSHEQKTRFLPPLASGEHIGCMGMSESDFGSDALGMQAKATRRGKEYILRGGKMWITNAPYAHTAYVYFRTGEERKNISTFILEKGKGHFAVGRPIHKMGMRASPTGELIFDETRVSEENRVGIEGDSVTHMMKNLEIERITISGISLGIASACVDQCLRYANERGQFGKTIGKYQLIQKMLAEMVTETNMMRNFLYNVAKRYDEGERGPEVAAQVKLALPKMATKIALDAIQIHGGHGYSREFPVERMMRDNKLNEIGAGTNEVMIMIVAKAFLEKQRAGHG